MDDAPTMINPGELTIRRDESVPPAARLQIYGSNHATRANLVVCSDGSRELVRIDLTTGEATFAEGVTPNEAARAFWAALKPLVQSVARHD